MTSATAAGRSSVLFDELPDQPESIWVVGHGKLGLSPLTSCIDLDAAPLASMAPKARVAAEKALALDPNLAEAHTSLGLVLMDAEWDFAGAEKEFRRAIELKPRFAYGVVR